MPRRRSQKQHRHFQFESLKPRHLLAGINFDPGTGILTINGSDASEAAYVNTAQNGQTSAWLQSIGVQLFDSASDDPDNFKSRGLVTNLNSNVQTFSFLGLTINYNGAEIEGSLANGNSVDVEGFFKNVVIDDHQIRPAQ